MKRDPRLVGLSREHHHALALAARLKKGAAAGESAVALAREAAAVFQREIEAHFQLEETLLLPALRALGDSDLRLVELGEADHAWLRAAAMRLAAGESEPLRDFGTRLADHVRFEERVLFERAQEALPAAVLDAINRARPS